MNECQELRELGEAVGVVSRGASSSVIGSLPLARFIAAEDNSAAAKGNSPLLFPLRYFCIFESSSGSLKLYKAELASLRQSEPFGYRHQANRDSTIPMNTLKEMVNLWKLHPAQTILFGRDRKC